MELENEMNSMDYLNLESNEIAITVIDTQGNRKYFTLNKLSKVKELCQLYLKETNQIGKAEVAFNLQGKSLDNDRTFEEQNVASDTVLHALIKIKSTVSIIVKDMNGETMNREVPLNSTLKDLYPNEVKNYTFSMDGKNLPIDKTFEQLGITNNKCIIITGKLPGGIL